MNRQSFFLMAALCLVGTAAQAEDDSRLEAQFFGRLTITSAMRPEFIHAAPVQALRSNAGSTGKPVVLHVRAGQEERWAAHCQAYDACSVPVRFVTERWFRNVYLPEVSGQDGREQRYRDLVRPSRNSHEHRHGSAQEE